MLKDKFSFAGDAVSARRPLGNSGGVRVAQRMISQFGSSAVLEARRRAAEALDRGDLSGFRGWHAILKAVRTILSWRR
jgi:hypothetical protein